MALHKDLTGADVHETKVTLSNGNPTTGPILTPSAAGVIMLDTSTTVARIWRAKSTTAGDWELICDINAIAAILVVLNDHEARIQALEAAT